MDTSRLQLILKDAFKVLEESSASALDVRLGLRRDHSPTDKQLTDAIETYLKPIFERRLPKTQVKLVVELARSEDKVVNPAQADLRVKVTAADNTTVTVPIHVPRQLGIVLGMPRHQLKVADKLPVLKEEQRRLLGAAAAVTGKRPDTFLADLLGEALMTTLGPILSPTTKQAQITRRMLHNEGFDVDKLLSFLLALNPKV